MYKKINSSGVIMIIVVVIIMVMSIIGVNIISQSMSQTKTARTQALQVVIEELTAGAFWGALNKQQAGVAYPIIFSTELPVHNHVYRANAMICDPSLTWSFDGTSASCVSGAGSNAGVFIN